MKTINQAEIIKADKNVNESSLECCLPVSVFMKEQKLLVAVRNSSWCFVKLCIEHCCSFPSPWECVPRCLAAAGGRRLRAV